MTSCDYLSYRIGSRGLRSNTVSSSSSSQSNSFFRVKTGTASSSLGSQWYQRFEFYLQNSIWGKFKYGSKLFQLWQQVTSVVHLDWVRKAAKSLRQKERVPGLVGYSLAFVWITWWLPIFNSAHGHPLDDGPRQGWQILPARCDGVRAQGYRLD